MGYGEYGRAGRGACRVGEVSGCLRHGNPGGYFSALRDEKDREFASRGRREY